MRKLFAACLVLAVVGCQSVAGPAPDALQGDDGPSVSAAASPNACPGQIVKGIAATWPWAHGGKVDYPPSPGAIALWIEIFGPGLGISSVHELQELFCSA